MTSFEIEFKSNESNIDVSEREKKIKDAVEDDEIATCLFVSLGRVKFETSLD